jgi:Ca2+-binding RTX toxin-like protein
VPASADFPVNTHTPGLQYRSRIAPLSSGGFVIAWWDTGGGAQLRARLFDQNGDPVTGEIEIPTDDFAYFKAVTGLSTGGFVLSWAENDAQFPYRAQIFDADGNAVGEELIITENESIAGLASGGFVAAWYGTDIWAQLYDGAGTAVGGPIAVNTSTNDLQYTPTVAALPGGGFVVAWRDVDGADAVRSQAFDADGAKVGSEVEVGSVTAGTDHPPVVAALASGNYVVTWQSSGDIFAQIVTESGSKVGGPLLVSATLGFQTTPWVTGLPDGGFAITWQIDGDVAVQVFDAAGTKVGSEFQANPTDAYTQWQPQIAALNGGRLVVSWTDDNASLEGETSSSGVRARLLYSLDTPDNDAPIVGHVAGDNALFLATPGTVLLDVGGNATVADVDSADFDGGSLTVAITAGNASAEDVLSVLDQGDGDGEIGVAGTAISFGGAQIGTIAAGGSGASGEPLVIDFNANATPDAVQALIRDIAYTNSQGLSSTAGQRALTWTLVDGDGTDGAGNDTATFTTTVLVAQHGTAGNDAPAGTASDDLFDLGQGGDDTPAAGGGKDIIYYGAAFDANDENDGGGGARDAVVLQGNYTLTLDSLSLVGVEYLSLQSGSIARWGDTAGNFYQYSITTVDANVADNERLVINAQSLQDGENFTFDGSAETGQGSYLVYGGRGTDTLRGGSGDDTFYFEDPRWNATDTVDGGPGYDMLQLSFGGGVNHIQLGDSQLANVERIELVPVFRSDPDQIPSYELVLANGNVAGGETLVVAASQLNATQTLRVDGSAVADGLLWLVGGAGDDELIGGAQADTFIGLGGADLLTGGAGADNFVVQNDWESPVGTEDEVLDFEIGTDKLDVHSIAGPFGFTYIGDDAFSEHAGNFHVRAELVGGVWHVEGDLDGDDVADFAILVTATTADPLTANDFIL